MKYRKFGKCDFEVSALGFGCMRFPVIDGDNGRIDEDKAIEMIQYAINNGVNYIDTAYPYHKGNSEIVVGKALSNGYRERVRLATKMPVWLMNSYEDFDKYLNEQLQKLQTDHIDFYLLHALSSKSWNKVKDLGVLDFVKKAIEDGRIKYAGFSFHDELPVFKEIVDSFDWTFCQIQYNFMDTDYQAGEEGLKYAAGRGLAVVIMEPLRGGKLAKNPPEEIQAIWSRSEINRTPVEWALKWIWNHPEVTTVLSGMSVIEHVEGNLKYADDSLPNSLSEFELGLVNEVRDRYLSNTKVGCTGCNYCMPCPFGVDIPENFSIYNNGYIYSDLEGAVHSYNNYFAEKNRADKCAECGKCEKACPQNIPIRSMLKDVHRVLGR